MKIESILFRNQDDPKSLNEGAPEFFSDLNLDQVFASVTERKQDYRLSSYFYTPLKDVDSIVYRQDVFRDLENESLRKELNHFAGNMVVVRRYLGVSEKSYYDNHKMGWHLEAALVYCDAVTKLVESLSQFDLKSQGLIGILQTFSHYLDSDGFIKFKKASVDLKLKLSSIQYNVVIKDNWVRVRKYNSEKDYSQEVEKFFSKFKHNEVKDFRIDLVIPSGMNHIEAKILDFVTKLFPEIFEELHHYYSSYLEFTDDTVRKFDREIQFYLVYEEFIQRIMAKGLRFCYPVLSSEDKAIHAHETFDIALAENYRKHDLPVICNDFFMEDAERIIVVSGPNQGGKTTFARMFAQLHYLACLGCPIPGQDARLFVFDQIFTHFEREEDIQNLRGKLKDDLVRIQHILDLATRQSIIVMNEIFTSTALKDAVFLGEKILRKIIQLDALAVCVTFIDELSTLGPQTVSMVSTVEADNPAQRTFKILRQPADGRAYAMHIARLHDLTYEMIKERIEQ